MDIYPEFWGPLAVLSKSSRMRYLLGDSRNTQGGPNEIMMGHILLPSVSTGKTYRHPRQGLGLINYTSECRTHTKHQGCVDTQMGPEHRAFIVLKADTQQVPGSRKWPAVCPPELVLESEKEILTVHAGIFTAEGFGAQGIWLLHLWAPAIFLREYYPPLGLHPALPALEPLMS